LERLLTNHKCHTDFESLAALPEFARFSVILTKLTGVPMSLQSPDGTAHITCGPEIKNPLCRIIRATGPGMRRCNLCDKRHSKIAGTRGKPLLYKCHAGFFDMIIPVFLRDIHVADIISGQILAEPPTEENFARLKKRLAWLTSDDTRLRKAYFNAPYMPRHKIKQMTALLEIFAVQLCESLRRIRELEMRLDRVEIRKAKEFMASNFSDPGLRLETIAARAGLSPAHFSHVFKRSTGESLTQHLQGIRVHEAKRLLERTGKSVSEICFDCGFNSLSNFIRVFRHKQQMTPGDYRAAAQPARAFLLKQ